MTNPKHTDTSRSGDLVETLLCVDRGGVLHSRRPKQTHPVCAKAADRIEALEAENERLREKLMSIMHGAENGEKLFADRQGNRAKPIWYAVNVLQDHLSACKGTARAAMQADAAPVAWMYERGSETIILQEPLHRDGVLRGATGWAETPLYAHPPVDDRVSTSSPVVAHETPETSGKLRDAVEVFRNALAVFHTSYPQSGEQAAAAVIEADRAALVAEISALRTAADKLAGYAVHDEDCETSTSHWVAPCTCGFSETWRAYQDAHP